MVNVGANISPSIHIEDMYDEGYTVDQAVKEIEEIKAQPLPNISIDAMTDYNVVKGNLRLRLYNEKTKADVFRSAADYGFDDLILVPYIQLDRGMAAKVNQSLVDMWGVPECILFADAMEATEANVQISILNMLDVIKASMASMGIDPDMLPPTPADALPQYVITSNTKMYAAIGAITMRNELGAMFPEGYYVIPSSIHECIVMSKATDITKQELTQMVKEINSSEVPEADVLSWRAYEF